MRLITLFLFVLMSLFNLISVNAQTLQTLHQQGHVNLKAWLEPTSNIATKQQVILVIDVGTDTWFSGGTKIGRFDVENLLILQRNKLATNYSEREKGVSWARQRWEISLYPLASGEYIIPQIPVEVNVTSSARKKITGTLLTPALKFNANLPSAKFTRETPWLSATKVDAIQQWNIEAGQAINVGDAIIREITIDADNTTAALIPDLLSSSTQQNENQILGRYYLAPDELIDTQPRGNYAAKRHEKITFIAQNSGIYQAPDINLIWWSTETNTLETLTLAGESYAIAHTPLSWLKHYATTLVFCVLALLVLFIFTAQLIKYYKTHPAPAILSFTNALIRRKNNLTRLLIYRKLRNKTDQELIANYLTNIKKNDKLLAQWQRPYQSTKTTSTLAYFKIWLAIKKHSIKRSIFPPALPALEKYKNKRDSNAQD